MSYSLTFETIRSTLLEGADDVTRAVSRLLKTLVARAKAGPRTVAVAVAIGTATVKYLEDNGYAKARWPLRAAAGTGR